MYIYTHVILILCTIPHSLSQSLATSPSSLLPPLSHRARVHFPSARSVHQPQWENAALSSAFSSQCTPCQIPRLPSFFPQEGGLHFLYLMVKLVIRDYLLIHIHFVSRASFAPFLFSGNKSHSCLFVCLLVCSLNSWNGRWRSWVAWYTDGTTNWHERDLLSVN